MDVNLYNEDTVAKVHEIVGNVTFKNAQRNINELANGYNQVHGNGRFCAKSGPHILKKASGFSFLLKRCNYLRLLI